MKVVADKSNGALNVNVRVGVSFLRIASFGRPKLRTWSAFSGMKSSSWRLITSDTELNDHWIM